jgi:hypothetical protein
MTHNDLLKQLLSSRPAETQIAEAATRARRRALGRFDAQHLMLPRVRRWPIVTTAAALATCSILIFWRAGELPAPAPPLPVSLKGAAEQPIKMILTLADGTRVIWTIDASLSL